MHRFEVGKVYQTRLICDHNLIIKMKVLERTEKTVVYKEENGKEKRAKIHCDNGDNYEYVVTARYSGAPLFRADALVEEEKQEETSYMELIQKVKSRDVYGYLLTENDLINLIKDKLEYRLYERAMELINALQQKRDEYGNENFWKMSYGCCIPLLTEQDILNNFRQLLN